ncbi:MAG: cysteine desulfurase [Planctomycetes bacterium]|nr:cysteine desulfurase [Planctomycetota bacterium]
MPEKSYIYCDWAAGGPPRVEVFDAVRKYATEHFANPGAHHPLAYIARRQLMELHERAAKIFACDPREIIFTSGGTESDILALRGVMALRAGGRDELVVSMIEHHAVLLCAEQMQAEGFKVRFAPVTADGVVDLAALKLLVNERTSLVSVMYANNETGVVQPVAEIARLAHDAGARYHCDAVQAMGKVDLKPRDFGADLMSLAGAKFGGPKGTGLLFNRMTGRLAPLMVGGPQEWGYRAGTEDTPGQAGITTALELAEAERANVWPRVQKIRDAMEAKLTRALGADIRINGRKAPRLPNISNISFLGIEGQALGIELGEAGFCVGLGSACAPGETDPSHVLRAMGLSFEDAQGCIRISFGADIKEADADRLADECIKHYGRLKVLGR